MTILGYHPPVRKGSIVRAFSALALTSSVALVGCQDPVAAGIEHVMDGRFARWPAGDAVEGDAWRQDGDATLTVPSALGHLVIEAAGGSPAGAVTRVPVPPHRPLQLSLRTRGGPGRLELWLDDSGAPLTTDLPASDRWFDVAADVMATRDGIRLRLLDEPGDGKPLRADDVRLVEPAGGGVAGEPPIRVLLVVHAENDVGTADRYWERRQVLADTADLAEARGLRLTALLSGGYAEWAIWEDDQAFYADLQARGHELGTYVFPVYHQAHLDWEAGNIFDEGMADREWADHAGWVDELVGADANRAVCAYAPMAEMARLMDEHGFDVELASVAVTHEGGNSRESVAWSYLGHHPHHPFRPADTAVEGEEYAGDPEGSYVSIGHAAQVGREEAHGTPCQLADYERIFGLLLDRWTAHQLAESDDDRVWVFGVLHNLKQGPAYGDELVQLLDHLDDVALSGTAADGQPVATGATASQVLAEFQTWEADHPGDPGFSFTLPP